MVRGRAQRRYCKKFTVGCDWVGCVGVRCSWCGFSDLLYSELWEGCMLVMEERVDSTNLVLAKHF